jgi:hypothetical protein
MWIQLLGLTLVVTAINAFGLEAGVGATQDKDAPATLKEQIPTPLPKVPKEQIPTLPSKVVKEQIPTLPAKIVKEQILTLPAKAALKEQIPTSPALRDPALRDPALRKMAKDTKLVAIPKDAMAGTVKAVDRAASSFTMTLENGLDKTFGVNRDTAFWDAAGGARGTGQEGLKDDGVARGAEISVVASKDGKNAKDVYLPVRKTEK